MNAFVRMITFFTRGTTIDNFVFRIHYQVTFTILIIFACIVGFEVYFRYPIKCTTRDDLDINELNTLCWVQSTFTLPDAFEKKVGYEVPFPGVDKYNPGETRIYHNNYQRVLLALWIQAIFFYLPRYFWKRVEGGRIYHLTLALKSPFLPEDEKDYKKRFVAEYLASNKNNHLPYFVCYLLAYFLNFVNVVGQVIFMNFFLGGDFASKVLDYGTDIWHLQGRSDALLQVFPRFTKCSIYRYGRSGDVQRHDALCFLSINDINEKIYVFLWIWCTILAIISFIALLYRVSTVIPIFRTTITSLRIRMVNKRHLESIVKHYGLGDWLILDFLAKNLDPLSFRDIIDDLINRQDSKL